MENRAYAFTAGLFVILLSIALAMTIKWFGSENITYHTYYLVSRGGSVSGLNPEASVRFRGVNVGKVSEIYFDPQNMHNIIVRIAVISGVTLPESAYAQLASQGITGLAYIELDDDNSNDEADGLAPEARIPLRSSLIKTLSDSAQEMLKNINEAAGRVNGLLSKQNQASIEVILSNLAETLQSYHNLANQLMDGTKGLPQLTNEMTTTFRQSRYVLSEVGQSLEKLNQQGGALDNIAQNSLGLTDTLTSLQEAGNSISQSARTLDQLMDSFATQPQSLLFGKSTPMPGPGEAGFTPPRKQEK
ncbi:MlaD family protein [Nitrosomonas mobilis]|uniref:Mammalian cell entry related domain protein n=1 Tax=Nitrosomonas mobilis TaxID=51642 RepID=A0A1G5SF92_9PROT|nr:MlaD family protein [Nitrosomonas mobilis]SCZ85510.1 Mammalian cell entry related domain protein [Nitrosomonas mobilis]